METPARRLAAIPGIGAALASRLVRRGYTTRARLRTIIDELPREAQAHLRHAVCGAIPAAAAAAVAGELRRRLVFDGSAGGRGRRLPVFVVGSARRGSRYSEDLDLLVVAPGERELPGLLAGARLRPPRAGDRAAFAETYAEGERRRSLVLRYAPPGRRPLFYAVDLFLATASEKPFALFHFTGPKSYSVRVRAHARRKGWKLNQYGLFYAADPARRVENSSSIRSERALAARLGVTHRPPAQRR